MLRKDWRLLAVMALVAAVGFTGCGKKKKKDSNATSAFTGMWINANAEKLAQMEANPIACERVRANQWDLGVVYSATTDQLSLDAWQIHSNGEVFLYTTVTLADGNQHRKRYFAGRVTGAASTGRYDRDRDSVIATYSDVGVGGAGLSFASPGAAIFLDGENLTVLYSNRYKTMYKRTNSQMLFRINSLLYDCQNRFGVRFGTQGIGPNPGGHPRWHGQGQPAPGAAGALPPVYDPRQGPPPAPESDPRPWRKD
ncbi:MAG: hypothetical protein AB7F86_18370 [Bdellovibrionales bacterium]